MRVSYFLPRLIRHFLPEKITRALLLRGLIIRPGLETRSPEEAADRYQRDLQSIGVELTGKQVFVFGYGGRFTLACHLLQMGADHVTLCEYSAHPDEKSNAALLPKFEKYLTHSLGKTIPREEWITLLQGDIRKLAKDSHNGKADIVCSTSVFEHLSDPASVLDALISITDRQGVHLHYIDLRDHFFKYPFEMLTYSDKTWKNWLNPTSNLNRWRFPAYQNLFDQRFDRVDMTVFERNIQAWNATSGRVLAEFNTGDIQVDSVTQIKVIARQKK